jgi:hypothetical protein
MGVCAFSGLGRLRGWCMRGAVLALALSGCAGGAESTTFGQPAGFDDGGGGSSSGTGLLTETSSKEEEGDEGQEGPGQGGDILPDFGSCTDDADCFSPEVQCFNAQGSCDGGVCMHAPRPAGEPCDDGEPCTEDDTCDGAGGCVGNDLECSASNTTPGTCNAGQCQGMTCVAGFGDCNADMNDGCETALTSASDCGGCGQACSAGAHATASCASGSCERSCESPWDNCDGDWGNGCEIPVGIPNQCDAGGLNPNGGCWTAYCGNSASADAVNFGTFFCADCATCHVPSAGACQWCNHSTGTWYPQDACACGGYLDLVCTP